MQRGGPESRYRSNRQSVGLLGLALAAWLSGGFGASSCMAAQGRKPSSERALPAGQVRRIFARV